MGVDSGYAATVVPEQWFMDYPVLHDQNSGVRYTTASGEQINDQGMRCLQCRAVKSDGGLCSMRLMRCRVTKVRKGLISVSDLVDSGHTVVFDGQRSYAQHKATGEGIELTRRNKILEMEFEVAKFDSAGMGPFGGQGALP